MMRAPPSPTAHQNFNFFSPLSSNHPEYSYEYPFMVQQNQQPKYSSVDKRRQQQQPQPTYSQPQSYSGQPAYAFNMQTGLSAAPAMSLQQTATPDSSRRQTPTHSPARQFVGSSAGDWPAMYVASAMPGTQFGGYSTADAPSTLVPKIETTNFLAPYKSETMGRIRSEGSQHGDLPPLSASSRPSVSEGGMFSPLTPASNPEIDELGHSAIHMSETVPKSEPLEGYQFATVAPPTSGPQPRHSHLPSRRMSPSTNIPDLYHQAQTQHSMDRSSHGISRSQHSPFRASSPFHPGRNAPASPARHSTHLMPNLSGYDAAREVIRTQAERVQSTPKTISPKEAFLEYHEPEDEPSKINLFAPTPSDSLNEDMMSQASNENHQGQFDFIGANHGMDFSGNFEFDAPAMPGIPHDYQYHGNQHIMEKPPMPKEHTTGPYACAMPGCTQRFPTPAKLQKHRRDVHRQTSPATMGVHGMTSTAHIPKSHIPGPHKCTRINPTTGKPCNTIFSRPYDLTRHEDTIHNTTREKARCEICNDEKTFSRQDALTRHKKVKHGIDK